MRFLETGLWFFGIPDHFVAYPFIDDFFTLWNMSVHLITHGTVLIELTLNRMPMFPDHCLLSAIGAVSFSPSSEYIEGAGQLCRANPSLLSRDNHFYYD